MKCWEPGRQAQSLTCEPRPLATDTDCFTKISFLWSRPLWEATELEVGTDPSLSNIDFWRMQGEPLASSHFLTGSALATSLWVGISPTQMCLLFILACLFVSRQSCSPVLMIALPPGIPPCSSLQHQGRNLDVRWWGSERTFWFSSF